MNNSKQEELIELTDFTSPTKSSNKSKKKNKIDTSPTKSESTTSRGDIVNIFSVKNTSAKLHENADSVSQSLSDISGGTFIVEKAEGNSNITTRSYKDKISKHLRNIKQKASTSHKLRTYKGPKSDFPIQKIRRENEDIDADIQSVKEKFKRNRKFAEEKRKFFFGVNEKKDDEIDKNEAETSDEFADKIFRYSLPEQLQSNIELWEKENCFIPNRKPVDINKKINEENNSLEETTQPKVTKGDVNLLEQRLLSTDDKRWFNDAGKLTFSENPLSENSIRPLKIKYHDRQFRSYQPAITQEECQEVIIIKENILELYLENLQFTFHPLFGIEHYFEQKLKDLYEQYTHSNELNLKRIKKQLDDLRKSRDKEKSNDEPHFKKIMKINKDIKKIRNSYFEEAKKHRDNLKCILETWKTIKKIRENQNYSSTDIKLIIKKENIEIDLENDEYKRNFDEILHEILEEKRVECSKGNKNPDENDNSESEPSSKNLPSDINDDKIKSELQKKFQRCFKLLGEPTLKLILSTENTVTDDIDNNKEVQRRNAVSSTKIYFKILCGKIEVCKSTPIPLNENFNLDIGETFSMQLVDIPEFLTIEIFEQPKELLKKTICEIEIKIPPRNVSIKNDKLQKATFEKNEIVHYKHEGIGSGVNLRTIIEDKNLTPLKENPDLYTAGYIQYYIGWDKVSRDISEDCLESQLKLINGIVDKNMVIDSHKLEEWLKQIPGLNIEGDSIFTQFGEGYDQSLLRNKSKYFRLNPYATSTKFCSITEIDQNVRLQILQLRNQHEVEFDGMIVPNRVKEIPYNLLADYKRRIAAESEGHFEEDEDEHEIETQRNFGKKYLKQVHIKIFQKCKNSDNNLAYESVVNEKHLIYFELMVKTLTKNFLNWFRWRPKIKEPLPVKVKDRDDYGGDYKIKNEVNIIVKICSGRNIPNRSKNTETMQDSESNLKVDEVENDVRPFVEVSYGNISVRTSTSRGVNPAWNETLTLPLESLHSDYLNPSSLNGSINVNLYDERESEIRNINRKSFTWLGGMDILLSAICYSNGIDGSFKIKLPHMLLGYETELDKLKTKSPKISNLQSNLLHTFLQMEVKIEPNVPKLTPNMEELPCGEVPYLQEYIIKWNQAYNNSYINRKFSVLVIDTNARTACITRYLKPLEPPQINLDEFDITAEQCLRYVSLIPFTECNQFYQSVLLSTDQLLRFMLGSINDHAVTLTCFLLALKLEAWLLLGFGIPHGSTAYVLTCEYTKETEAPTYYIYDVVYNEKYNVTDSSCPLRTIYCLINGDNVWANIQRNDNIILTRFDLTRRSDWLPLFTSNVSAPTNFINNKVSYHSCTNLEDLEIQLERKIRKKVAKLRQLDRTIWNNNLGNTFKNILKSFDVNCMYNKNHFETLTEVNKELSSYNVIGYIINMPFTNTSAIVKKIKSLGIHVQEDRNIEFAFAIHIQGYPGQLLSVWVLLVNIKQKHII